MIPRSLLLGLAGLGLVLTATVVPAVFTVDEDYYLATLVALRHGRLTVPGTEGLTPSSELLYFDPQGHSREVTSTPVASTAPPLYAPLALPFSWLGWRGLVGLNTLAFLAAAVVVFAFTRRHASAPATPWLAVAAFALGGYSLEYAQGVWPHMLAALLCLGAFVLAARVRDGAPLAVAFAAGLCAGLAAGVRYQNVALAGCVGLGVAIWAPRRLGAGRRLRRRTRPAAGRVAACSITPGSASGTRSARGPATSVTVAPSTAAASCSTRCGWAGLGSSTSRPGRPWSAPSTPSTSSATSTAAPTSSAGR